MLDSVMTGKTCMELLCACAVYFSEMRGASAGLKL